MTVTYHKLTTALFLLTFYGLAMAQVKEKDKAKLAIADSLFHHKFYRRSARQYFNLFKNDTASRSDLNLFKAAEACSKARLNDSAFQFLYELIHRGGQPGFDQILYDPDLKNLQKDKRWPLMLQKMEFFKGQFNSPVSAELIGMKEQCEALLKKQAETASNTGRNWILFRAYRDSLTWLDSLNRLKLRSIINTYSWPGPHQIGKNGSQALVYIFFRLDAPEQKRYYPLIVTAFRQGKIDAKNFAAISDKLSLSDTGKQIYGTQYNGSKAILYPVMNRDSLNLRRMAIGLTPLADSLIRR
ncbi:MAG TPA: DUF6624 domain-containing protein [Mucilaginibacter sp.]|nr:DUF6624 domain-containing protein [Mucilaginibacter sp.]